MKKTNFARSLMAVVVGSVLVSGSVLAEDTMMGKAQGMLNSADEAVDSSMQKIDKSVENVGAYVDDSAITGKVKSALISDKSLSSNDISVSTSKGIVTLSGFTTSAEQSAQAVKIAAGVKGVVSVTDKLNVKAAEESKIETYASDAAITGKVKAKLLGDSLVPSRNVTVETASGVVQLTGTVNTQAESVQAETLAKSIEGVTSVKNDLVVQP